MDLSINLRIKANSFDIFFVLWLYTKDFSLISSDKNDININGDKIFFFLTNINRNPRMITEKYMIPFIKSMNILITEI